MSIKSTLIQLLFSIFFNNIFKIILPDKYFILLNFQFPSANLNYFALIQINQTPWPTNATEI